MADEKYIRVKHIGTGHHSTINARTFNPEAHELLKSPAIDSSGRRIPPKYNTPLGGSPAAKKDEVPQK